MITEYNCIHLSKKYYTEEKFHRIEYVSLYHIYIYRKKSNRKMKVDTSISKFKLNREYHEHEIIKDESKSERINRLKEKWKALD